MAAYPFFASVAETAGRLLRLQCTVGAAQVQRRMREQLGERQIVGRATRHVLRTMVDWGVLHDTAEKGVYVAAPQRALTHTRLAPWLMEAILVAGGTRVAQLRSLTQSPALFPFALGSVSVSQLKVSERVETYRQGLNEDVVALRG